MQGALFHGNSQDCYFPLASLCMLMHNMTDILINLSFHSKKKKQITIFPKLLDYFLKVKEKKKHTKKLISSPLSSIFFLFIYFNVFSLDFCLSSSVSVSLQNDRWCLLTSPLFISQLSLSPFFTRFFF